MKRSAEPSCPPGLLEQIVESLPGVIAYWDSGLICRFANRAHLDLFAEPVDFIIGSRMQDLLGKELFAASQVYIEGVLRGEPQSFVRTIRKPDGSAAKIQVNYVPDCDAGGDVIGFYVSTNDVTAFKRIEEQLRDKEAELTTLVARRDDAICWLEMAEEIAHVGHWRMSLPSGTMNWSDEMYRIHGVTREGYVPALESALDFYWPEDRARLQALMQRALTEGLPYEDMGQLLCRDGEVRYVKSRGMAAAGPDGSPVTIFGVVVDVTEQQKAEHALRVAYERLEAIALVDGLTGISNRRRFDEAFTQQWQAATRNGQALSVVLIDVDWFKPFNDTYGHQSGDECLQAVADALRSAACRPEDVVARYGGEEFIILLPATDLAGAVLVAERARAAVEAMGRRHEANGSGVVTISAGIGSIRCICPNRDKQRQLIAEADAMLYHAKANGRNVVVSRAGPHEAERAAGGCTTTSAA